MSATARMRPAFASMTTVCVLIAFLAWLAVGGEEGEREGLRVEAENRLHDPRPVLLRKLGDGARVGKEFVDQACGLGCREAVGDLEGCHV